MKQGWAYKATYAEIDGKPIMVYKDPKTGDGTKKSQKGMVHVYRDEDDKIKFIDGIYKGMVTTDNLMKTVFKDGDIISYNEQSLSEIRSRIHDENGGF